jgi:hypothetical protein
MWYRKILVTAALVVATSAAAETMSNDSVVSLAAAGLGDEVVIAKIRASETAFDLSTEGLTQLKAKGVSSRVIATMIERGAANQQQFQSMDSPDPLIAHPAGVYLLDEGATASKMRKIETSGSSQIKIGNTLGYAFSYGIAPMSVKVALNGTKANVVTTSRQPVFFMFTAQAQKTTNPYAMMVNPASMMLSSPNELSLVRLISKSGHREAKIGNYSISGAQSGVMDKDRIDFKYALVREGVFKVTLKEPLSPGEYAFVKGFGALSSVFDFSVQ